MDTLILYLILLVGIVLVIRKIIHHFEYSWYGKNYQKAFSQGKELQKTIVTQVKDLGANEEEREKEIGRLFDEKKQILFWIDTDTPQERFAGRKNRSYAFKVTKLSRSIATLANREREFTRYLFFLFNYGKIDFNDFRSLFHDLIFADGKAMVETYPSHGTETFWFSGETSRRDNDSGDLTENAINKILKILDGLKNDDPIKIKINKRIRGGGVWLDESDIQNSIFRAASDYRLKIGRLSESNYVLTYSDEGSLITIAPPGSGKTQCFVLPNMFEWGGAAFVLDIKGEIYAATHEWRSKNVGKVYKFSPLDPASSHSYNPLIFINQNPDYLWEDSRFLADMMIVPSGASDPFWENMARDIVTAAIAHVCLNNEPEKRPMSKVLDLLYGIGLSEMIVDLKHNDDISAMRQIGHSLFNMETKTLDSALKTAQTYLSAWQGERIKRVTQKSDWNPSTLREEKATVYICINPNEIDSYLSLLRVIIAQHIRILTSKLPERSAVPILFMLDELPRLKKMLPVEEALNIGRQYAIKLWMFAQSYGQLKQAYPNADGFLGSCAVRTFMNIPLNDELLEKICNQLGYVDSPFDSSRRRMVEPLELAGPDYRDIVLLHASNSKPARVRKSFAWQDEELKGKMKV